eukprot:UN26428
MVHEKHRKSHHGHGGKDEGHHLHRSKSGVHKKKRKTKKGRKTELHVDGDEHHDEKHHKKSVFGPRIHRTTTHSRTNARAAKLGDIPSNIKLLLKNYLEKEQYKEILAELTQFIIK